MSRKLSPLRTLLKIRLADMGESYESLAKFCGCSRSHIENSLSGHRAGRTIFPKIEEFIGLPLWSAPNQPVEIPLGASGLTVSIPAISVIPFEISSRALSEINPDGTKTFSEMQAALVKLRKSKKSTRKSS